MKPLPLHFRLVDKALSTIRLVAVLLIGLIAVPVMIALPLIFGWKGFLGSILVFLAACWLWSKLTDASNFAIGLPDSYLATMSDDALVARAARDSSEQDVWVPVEVRLDHYVRQRAAAQERLREREREATQAKVAEQRKAEKEAELRERLGRRLRD